MLISIFLTCLYCQSRLFIKMGPPVWHCDILKKEKKNKWQKLPLMCAFYLCFSVTHYDKDAASSLKGPLYFRIWISNGAPAEALLARWGRGADVLGWWLAASFPSAPNTHEMNATLSRRDIPAATFVWKKIESPHHSYRALKPPLYTCSENGVF